MKIWMDDIRRAPEGYVVCKSVNETIEQIKKCQENNITIDIIDCDHDLGDYAKDGGDGIKLLDYLVENDLKYPISLHTANPVGRMNMRRILSRHWDGHISGAFNEEVWVCKDSSKEYEEDNDYDDEYDYGDEYEGYDDDLDDLVLKEDEYAEPEEIDTPEIRELQIKDEHDVLGAILATRGYLYDTHRKNPTLFAIGSTVKTDMFPEGYRNITPIVFSRMTVKQKEAFDALAKGMDYKEWKESGHTPALSHFCYTFAHNTRKVYEKYLAVEKLKKELVSGDVESHIVFGIKQKVERYIALEIGKKAWRRKVGRYSESILTINDLMDACDMDFDEKEHTKTQVGCEACKYLQLSKSFMSLTAEQRLSYLTVEDDYSKWEYNLPENLLESVEYDNMVLDRKIKEAADKVEKYEKALLSAKRKYDELLAIKNNC